MKNPPAGAHSAAELFARLEELSRQETHRPQHYDLTVDLEPVSGRISVEGVVHLFRRGDEAGSGTPDGGSEPARFLLHPDLELEVSEPAAFPPGAGASVSSSGETSRGSRRTLRSVALPTGASEMAFRCRGLLPGAWSSPEGTELAFYCLWFPLFAASLPPFTFRVTLRVPPTTIPVMSGNLLPLPPALAPAGHDDAAPRTYLWESDVPANDIALCAGPFHVHQRLHGDLMAEAYVLAGDYDLGERYVDAAGRVLEVLSTWFGPLRAVTSGVRPYRLAVAVPPHSNWGGYSRPNLIVAPRPLSQALRDPETAPSIEAFLAHEMGHIWFGTGVRSDTMGEPWLSEAFAEFARLVYFQAVLGEDRYRRLIERYAGEVAAVADPRPMREVTTAHPEMDALARRRGALMLVDLRETIGDSLMAHLLTGFAARYAGRHVTAEDFTREAAAVSGRDLSRLFTSYLDEPPATSGSRSGTT